LLRIFYQLLKTLKLSIMKKLFALVAAVVVAFSANAQIAKGDVVVTAGVGLGNTVYGSGFDNALLPINLEGEFGVAEELFGVSGLSLGVGPAISYTQAKQDYSYLVKGAGYKYSSILVGAKGYFHYNLFNVDKLDTYAALTLGWNVASAKAYGWGEYSDLMTAVSAGGFYYAFAIGARYWFTDAIGANLEAGYGLSFLKAGVTFKF
jgi:hypothetical protein